MYLNLSQEHLKLVDVGETGFGLTRQRRLVARLLMRQVHQMDKPSSIHLVGLNDKEDR